MPIRDNIIDFQRDLSQAAKVMGVTLRVMVKAILFELVRMIVIQTPVDTGRAAGSWMVRANGVDDFVLGESAHLSREEAVEQVLAKVNSVDFSSLNTVYWIFNNLPYIAHLEYGLYPDPPKHGSWVKGHGYVIKTVAGYSKQAPAGMVRISIVNMDTKLDLIVRTAVRP